MTGIQTEGHRLMMSMSYETAEKYVKMKLGSATSMVKNRSYPNEIINDTDRPKHPQPATT